MASVGKRTWTHNGVTKTKPCVHYTDHEGKKREKVFERKKDADRYRPKVEPELQGGYPVADPAPGQRPWAARHDLRFDCLLRAEVP